MDIGNAMKNFLEIDEILNRCEIKYYLSEGTLLGAIRDGNFIAWDHDLDLRVEPTDWKSSMREEFERSGFQYLDAICPKLYQDKSSGCVVIKRDIHTDVALNYYYPPEDLRLTLPHRPNTHNTLRPARFYRGDHFIDFLGIKVRVPYPPEEYLQMLYGKDWRIPRKDNCYLSCQKPISMEKYIKYLLRHPEINQGK